MLSDHIAGDAPRPRRRADVASRHAASRQPGLPSLPRARGLAVRHGVSRCLVPPWDLVIAMLLLGGITAALLGFEYQFRHLEAYTAA